MSGWKNRIAGWFIDREFFMRANGQVRFLKISAQLQRRTAFTLASVIGVWLLVTFGMAINQMTVSAQRLALTEQEAKVESAGKKCWKAWATNIWVIYRRRKRKRLPHQPSGAKKKRP
jgi:hypothetical protein